LSWTWHRLLGFNDSSTLAASQQAAESQLPSHTRLPKMAQSPRPEINRIHSVNISLRAGAKLVLGARVYLAPPPTEKRGTSLQFSIQKDWLPRCTLYLSEGGEGGPKSFVVDLNAFYKASERDQDAKWIRVWPAPGKSPYD
jgi:hypothetical protein